MDAIDKINYYLVKQGKTGADLSRALGLSNSVYSQWNTGRTKPKKSKLMAIAEYLGVSVSDLQPDEDEGTTQKSPIVARINSLLAEKGISKTDFYRDCGITSATYSMWNTGKTQPRKKNIQTIAEYLGVSVSDLLPDDEDIKKERPAESETPNKDALIDFIHNASRDDLITLLEEVTKTLKGIK